VWEARRESIGDGLESFFRPRVLLGPSAGPARHRPGGLVGHREGTVLATLRVLGQDDFVKEWPLDELVTLVRGP
jgi:hypothetical protein